MMSAANLAERFGMKLAGDIAPSRRSKGPPMASPAQLRLAEREAGYVAVVITGPPRRVPRYFGDNDGCWPVKVGITKNPRDYLRTEDRGWQEVVLLACVWTNGLRYAERLKAAVERMIAAKSEPLRRSWHDLEPEIAELTLAFAAEQEGIEVFDWAERQRRLAAAVERAVKGLRQMR